MGNRELAQVLRTANPWWSRQRRTTWPDDDVDLSTRSRHELVAASRAAQQQLSDLAGPPRPGDTVLVYGPPGVGKTTAVKALLIQVLADPAVDPRAVVWVPVPEVVDDLAHIQAHPSLVGIPACDGVRLWVLDEVTAATGWTQALGATPRGAVLATGSCASQDELDQVRATYPASGGVRMLRTLSLADLLMASPGLDPATVRADYLVAGGYPRAAAELRDLGAVSPQFIAQLMAGLGRGVCPNHPEPEVPRLLAAVCGSADRCVQVHLVAEALDIEVERAAACLDRLTTLGVLDPVRGFVDPLLHWLPHLVDPATYPEPTAEHVATFSH
ncbi:MAG: ATP-binding protein [Actinobacteria bacterium]|nr:ATP-binding protein [Actinomycetota bacterium]